MEQVVDAEILQMTGRGLGLLLHHGLRNRFLHRIFFRLLLCRRLHRNTQLLAMTFRRRAEDAAC